MAPTGSYVWRQHISSWHKTVLNTDCLTLKLLLDGSSFSALLTETHFSPLGCFHTCWQLSLADTPWCWHLQHLWVSNRIHVSPLQLDTMAPLGLHADTSQTHSWPQWVSLTGKTAEPLYSYIFLDSKPRTCQSLHLYRPPSWITFTEAFHVDGFSCCFGRISWGGPCSEVTIPFIPSSTWPFFNFSFPLTQCLVLASHFLVLLFCFLCSLYFSLPCLLFFFHCGSA